METSPDLSTNNRIVRERFDLQAQQFDDWHITADEQHLSSFFEFAGLSSTDDLLDVACGTGRFSAFAAARVASVRGADISHGMIDVARGHAVRLGIANAEFVVQEGECLPFADETFSVVTSKAAFHHMENHESVFSEMTRCCKVGGTVCLQDIVSYDPPEVDRYFEDLELAIDISHHRTLRKREVFELFKRGPFRVERLFETQALLDVQQYAGHAVQMAGGKVEVDRLVARGLADPIIAPYFERKGESLSFRRRVFVVAGTRLA